VCGVAGRGRAPARQSPGPRPDRRREPGREHAQALGGGRGPELEHLLAHRAALEDRDEEHAPLAHDRERAGHRLDRVRPVLGQEMSTAEDREGGHAHPPAGGRRGLYRLPSMAEGALDIAR